MVPFLGPYCFPPTGSSTRYWEDLGIAQSWTERLHRYGGNRWTAVPPGGCVLVIFPKPDSWYINCIVWIWCHVSLSATDIFQNIGYRSILRKTYIINFHQNHPRTKTCPFLFDFSWKRRVPLCPPRTKQPWLTGHKQWDIIVICY